MQMGVVNRDIKLENSLLDGSKKPLLKLCDFGYSKSNIDSVPKSNVGTPGYAGAWHFMESQHHHATSRWCQLHGLMTVAYSDRVCA